MSGVLERGFLDDIVNNIDDDTPRLVYADWLIDNGKDDRAEFIRVQVERFRLPAWDARQVRLKLREQELLRLHSEQWLAELPTIEGAKWEGFRRGIVAEVSFIDYEAMRKCAHACRAVAPVEAVTVRWPRKRDVTDSTTPIAELRELSLTGRAYNIDEVACLADSPQLATLRNLCANGLWTVGLERLVVSPYLARLRSLRLPSNQRLGNAGLLALIRADTLTGLEDLDLAGWGVWERYRDDTVVQDSGIEALAAWPGLASVRSLNLGGNNVGRGGLRALLGSPHLGALKELSLRSGRFEGQMLEEFLSASTQLRLETLDFGENVLGDLGVEYLAIAPCLRELKELRLDRCEIPLLGARTLAKTATFLEGLRILDVSHNHFGPDGLGDLLARGPASLHTLRLRDNDLFDKGVEVLANSPASNALLEVDLSHNMLRGASVQMLGDAAHLRSLLVLRLKGNIIIKSDIANLVTSPLGQQLASLDIRDELPPPQPMLSDDDPIPF